MTYCVGIRLNAGLVFLSDSRTNAGVDQISTCRKMMIYERRGDRFIVLMSAGNLSISQSVREILQVERLEREGQEPLTLWNATSMFDVARVLGSAVRRVYAQDGPALRQAGLDFNAAFILGGQIRGEAMRLFQIYAPGNFIEATREACFFQIGESKYGKPILDRVLEPGTPLDEATKCALISMDSTLKSNLSVGLPLDLVVYRDGALASDEHVCIDEQNPYFQMIRSTWGARLREVFEGIEQPHWGDAETASALGTPSERYERLRKVGDPSQLIV